MTEVYCECGRFIGRFQGKYDVRCRCKRIARGDTEQPAAVSCAVPLLKPPKIPRNMIVIR